MKRMSEKWDWRTNLLAAGAIGLVVLSVVPGCPRSLGEERYQEMEKREYEEEIDGMLDNFRLIEPRPYDFLFC